MKKEYEKISTANVGEMEKVQLDEFNKELNKFKNKTKFLTNERLLKILYMVFGYALGIPLGILLAKTVMDFTYANPLNTLYLIFIGVLGVVCIAVEVAYRTMKKIGQKYSKCITEKEGQIKNRYDFIKMKEEFIASKDEPAKTNEENKAE